jgi:hypothetical protein
MKGRIKLFALPFVAIILISCNLLAPGGPISSEATPDLVQTLTAIAPGSQALVPTTAGTQDGQPSPFPSATANPTQSATETGVPVVGITPVAPTATRPAPTATRPAPTAVTRCNWAQFLGDVTIPDGTEFTPGKTFVKKWRLKNIGTCTWTQDYQLIFNCGAAMVGPTSVSLPAVVPPGSTVDAAVTLTAPAAPGNYTGNWKLANAAGAVFGIGSDAQGTFYVNIKVVPVATQALNTTRINFLSYATSSRVAGSMNNGGHPPQYVLRVMGGQTMMVSIDSPNQDFYICIYGSSTGEILLDASAAQTSWQGRVPSTQDYVIETFWRGSATNFTLNITIPERIAFQAGGVSTSLSGPLRPNETHSFVLRATAGQTMTLTLAPTDQTVLLAFYGYDDGQPYLRTVTGQTSWTGQVPATQDYIVQVVSVIASDTTFTLTAKIQ